jgi:hypothetical protein
MQSFNFRDMFNHKSVHSWASTTKSYHNGGVEGDSFAKWYADTLSRHYSKDDGPDGGKGSGSGGTKGSGSGGTKGSGSGGTKGSGSGGTKGSGSGGTKGSGSGGTKGSGSGGTKGSGSGGTKGSGSGGTKGSGSGGTKGSGSGGTKGSGSVRESFEWDLAPDPNDAGPIDNFDDLSQGFTQNTGHVDVTFSVLGASVGAQTEFYNAEQNTDAIIDDGAPVDAHSAMSSFLNTPQGAGQHASYELDFSKAVTNVSFRINDIDTDALVRVQAFDADGNQIGINLTAGAAIELSDTDAISGNDLADSIGPDGPSNSPDASVLVDIGGPVSRIVIEHSQDGPNNTGIDVTDIYFDVETDGKGSGTGGSGTSGCGSTSYHNGGVEGDEFDSWYDDNLSGHYGGSGSGGTKGSGSGGTKGSGSGGTKGSGSGGTKGSGSGGTKGSGSGGTKGSGSGGTKGSGSGGTKGSGSGGTKGSGSGGTKGSAGSGKLWDAAAGLPAYGGEPMDDGDDGETVVYASGTGGSGGTNGSAVAGSGPTLEDILGLMTVVPSDDDPSLIDPDEIPEDDYAELI